MVGEVGMSLMHETTTKPVGYSIGDMKMVTYDIAFTLHQLVEPEPGWLLLNGATITSGAYPILFARFGSTLPDLTDGVVPVPKGLTNLTSWNTTGGEINHTLSASELATHSHPDTFSFSVGSHGHSNASFSISAAGSNHQHDNNRVNVAGGVGNGGGFSGDTPNAAANIGSSNNGGHGHTASTSVNSSTSPNVSVGGSITAAGSGGSHNNMQPYLVMGGWLVRHG